jgi:hypothetical protein
MKPNSFVIGWQIFGCIDITIGSDTNVSEVLHISKQERQ